MLLNGKILVKQEAEKEKRVSMMIEIKRVAVADPFVTSRHIKEDLNLKFSFKTGRRRLVKSKLVVRSPRKVFLLKKRHLVAG